MDESCYNAYFESLRRRTGGFLAEGTEPVISPFPLPWTGFVTVFLPSAFNPKTGLGATLGFFGGWRSVFSGCFLLKDELAEPGPFEVCPPVVFT